MTSYVSYDINGCSNRHTTCRRLIIYTTSFTLHNLRQDLHLQRADACQPGEAGRWPEEEHEEPQGLRDRSQRQSGRPARPGDRRLRRLPRQGSDRAHQGARSRGDAARQCTARRHQRRQADHRPHQRRLGLGLRNRRRRATTPRRGARSRPGASIPMSSSSKSCRRSCNRGPPECPASPVCAVT